MNQTNPRNTLRARDGEAPVEPHPESLPHGTTKDQIAEMECEGQAQQPGQDVAPETPAQDSREGAPDKEVGDRTGPGAGNDLEPEQRKDRQHSRAPAQNADVEEPAVPEMKFGSAAWRRRPDPEGTNSWNVASGLLERERNIGAHQRTSAVGGDGLSGNPPGIFRAQRGDGASNVSRRSSSPHRVPPVPKPVK